VLQPLQLRPWWSVHFPASAWPLQRWWPVRFTVSDWSLWPWWPLHFRMGMGSSVWLCNEDVFEAKLV
jgi:hypothetical protein